MRPYTRRRRAACALATLTTAVAVAACDVDLNVPSLNNPTAGGAATRSSVVANAHGLLVNARNMSTAGGMVATFGVWGRELYVLAPEEPRPYVDNLIGPRDPSSSGTGAGFNYGTLVNVRALLRAVDVVSGMSEQEKEGVRGWAKTVAACAYTQTAMVYPEFGAPLEPPENPTGELAPVATSEQLYTRALTLYDEAYAHLQAAGPSFPLSLTAGYAGFNTPATFATFNRALKARALKYGGDFVGVLPCGGEDDRDTDVHAAGRDGHGEAQYVPGERLAFSLDHERGADPAARRGPARDRR